MGHDRLLDDEVEEPGELQHLVSGVEGRVGLSQDRRDPVAEEEDRVFDPADVALVRRPELQNFL